MGTIANKVNKIKNTKDKIKTMTNLSTLNAITSETIFKEYPKQILKEYVKIINNGTDELYANFPKIENEDTKLKLDTEKGPLKITPEGNTSQDGDPTPEVPIPIKVVTGNNTITVCGSNLFDYTEHNGLTLDSNGRITTTKYYTQATTVIYKLKPNTKYTFSFRNRNMAFSNYGLSMTVNGTWVQTNTGKYTLTSDSNGEFAIKLGADSYNTIGKASTYIQLEEGTTVTEFVPYYTPQTYPISLSNIELVKIENYKDYIFKNETISQYYNSNLDENAWYYSNLFTKINNYSGETITTDYISTTGGLDSGATIYYYNSQNTPIKITDETLISQLENINNNAKSYSGTTIIECSSSTDDNETIQVSTIALEHID